MIKCRSARFLEAHSTIHFKSETRFKKKNFAKIYYPLFTKNQVNMLRVALFYVVFLTSLIQALPGKSPLPVCSSLGRRHHTQDQRRKNTRCKKSCLLTALIVDHSGHGENLLFRGRMAITNAVLPQAAYADEVSSSDRDATMGASRRHVE